MRVIAAVRSLFILIEFFIYLVHAKNKIVKMVLKRKNMFNVPVCAALFSVLEGRAVILAHWGRLNSCTSVQLPQRIYSRTELNLNISPDFFQPKAFRT